MNFLLRNSKSSLDLAEDRINELENRLKEIQNEIQSHRERNMKEKIRHIESKVRNLIGIPEGVRDNKAKIMFHYIKIFISQLGN